MCGRITQYRDREAWKRDLELDEFTERYVWRPAYNLAPTQNALIVRHIDGKRVAEPFQWGLVPSWMADPKASKYPPPINARADGVATKPMFRSAFKSQRCIVPADGFYEWQATGGKTKQPFYITERTGVLPMAGIWERWQRDGELLETFAIVTTEANELMAKIHDRMPVILAHADIDAWLAGDAKTASKLLTQYPSEKMQAVPVSTYVSNARNQGEKCIEPLQGMGELFA